MFEFTDDTAFTVECVHSVDAPDSEMIYCASKPALKTTLKFMRSYPNNYTKAQSCKTPIFLFHKSHLFL